MNFGGSSEFGAAQFGGQPFGLMPGYVCGRIVASMERFRRSGDSGCLATLGRLTGSLSDADTWSMMLQAGTPAVLVVYEGATLGSEGMASNVITQRQRYSVVCIASDYRTRSHRLQGRNVYEPALDNITRWVMYFAGRAVLRLGGVPTKEELRTFGAEKFVGIVSFEISSQYDLYDDDATLLDSFERLGIVHSPSNVNSLFADDNVTPRTDSPTSPATGYAEIGDDSPDASPQAED